MSTKTKLTKARHGALAVLNGGPARYSNLTIIERTSDGQASRNVYWESADWLIDNGYAERAAGGEVIITERGRDRYRAEQQGTA